MATMVVERPPIREMARALGWQESWGPVPSFATPRTWSRPTAGPLIAKTAERIYRRPLFGWQRYAADLLGEVLPDGSWAYDDVTMLVPRRGGKNHLVNAVGVQRALAKARATIWITGQKRDKAVSRWRDVREELRLSVDEEIKTLASSKISQGAEEMRFSTGSLWRPFPPDDENMHGEQPEIVFVDELWAFSLRDKKLMQAAYRPSWAFESGQEIKISAAGIRGKSGWLEADRAAGRAVVLDQLERTDARQGIALVEWGVPDSARAMAEDAVRDRRTRERLMELVAAHHPRPGLRTSYLEAEFSRDPADFLRAYGNLDDLDGGGDTAIPLGIWNKAQWKGETMTPDGVRFGFGVAVDPDGLEAAIYAACRLDDGRGLVSRVEVAPGTRWLPGRLVQILEDWSDVDAVAVGNIGADRDVADALVKALGERVIRLPVADDKAALARFTAEIEQGPRTLHDGALDGSLLEALRAARVSRGQWDHKVGSRDPFSALPAAHRALWAADHLPEPVKPMGRFQIF